MPYHCSVPYCRGNYDAGPKVTVFQFPKGETLRRKWLSSIGRVNFAPSPSSKVCHVHFKKEDVIWETRICDERTGQVLVAPLKKPRLRLGAVSLLFPNCPPHLSKEESRHEGPAEKNLGLESEHLEAAVQKGFDDFSFSSLEQLPLHNKEVELPCELKPVETKSTVRGSVQGRTSGQFDHTYARPIPSKSKTDFEDVADPNQSRTAGRHQIVAEAPNGKVSHCGSRVVPSCFTKQKTNNTASASESGVPRRVSGFCNGIGSSPRPGRPLGPPLSHSPSPRQYKCAVFQCDTNARKMPGVVWHSFPKDEYLRCEWIARCKCRGRVNVKGGRVCSLHFRPEDYEQDLRNELLRLPSRKKLVPTAIPSLNILSWNEGEIKKRKNQRKKGGRIRKKLRQRDDDDNNVDTAAHQIPVNHQDVVTKNEVVVKPEVESDPDDVLGADGKQEFEYVTVEEQLEDRDEPTRSATEKSYEQMGHDQELPVIIKEEIDCDDYIDPFGISGESCEQVGHDQELPVIIKEEIDCDDYIDPFSVSKR
ncbi:uncharacterized protein LOC124554052 isoform X1 [Schistocerca americana]|uniref:uncharacterized protein LOC124554052 isoform X1 n=1 Tax=Schistocerca americana TaxID=7009 RepID=UPI001F4F2897|nr:uncharacterized protein LOC124554052 isoform X1 [Schistocerca americana]